MNGEALFEIWAPVEPTKASWSRWAKPVLFDSRRLDQLLLPPERLLPWPDAPWAPGPTDGVAVVIDVPGERAIELGVSLAERGFCPVPLFNGTDAPVDNRATVRTHALVDALLAGGAALAKLTVAPEAPPAFLLDRDRRGGAAALGAGVFDNRWVVLPQDMPSAAWLLANGIVAVRVVGDGDTELADDLRHVLYGWQEAGLSIDGVNLAGDATPHPVHVRRPRGFAALWYTALVLFGLRRNSTGGFGSMIPEPSQSSGVGFGRGGFG